MQFPKVVATLALGLGALASASSVGSDSHYTNMLAARDELLEAQNNYLIARDVYNTIEDSLFARDFDDDFDGLLRRDEIPGWSGIAQARKHAQDHPSPRLNPGAGRATIGTIGRTVSGSGAGHAYSGSGPGQNRGTSSLHHVSSKYSH